MIERLKEALAGVAATNLLRAREIESIVNSILAENRTAFAKSNEAYLAEIKRLVEKNNVLVAEQWALREQSRLCDCPTEACAKVRGFYHIARRDMLELQDVVNALRAKP